MPFPHADSRAFSVQRAGSGAVTAACRAAADHKCPLEPREGIVHTAVLSSFDLPLASDE